MGGSEEESQGKLEGTAALKRTIQVELEIR